MQDWVKEQNRMAKVVQAHLRKGRASRFERISRRRKTAVFDVGDYVLVSRKRFKQLEVPKGATKDVLWYGPYLVTGVSSGGITARCSPTLGGEVPVAFEFVKRFPFDLVDDYGEDTIEEGDTDMLTDESEQRWLMNRISWRMSRIYHSTIRLRWRELELITSNRS